MIYAAAILIGYVCGLFQTAFIYGKLHGVDIRKEGSGNAGSTNALRTFGKGAGGLVLLGDFLKCVVAALIVYFLIGRNHPEVDYLLRALTGLGCALGHDFPFWMKFRGGKGVASSSIAFVIFDPFWGLLANIAGMLVVFATKYLCIGGVVIPVFLGIIYAVFFNNIEALIILIVFAALAFYCHFSKIAGIPSGKTERTDVIGALRRRLNPGKLVLLLLTAIVIVTADAYFFGPLAGLLA